MLFRSAVMRIAPAKWLVTKYDELNRPIETGLWTNATTFATHRTNALTIYPYPATTSGYELLSVTHYDDYSSIPVASGLNNSVDGSYTGYIHASINTSPYYAQSIPSTASTKTKGKITWTQTKVVGTASTFLYGLNIYDDNGRLIQVKSTNITTGTDIATTQYSWTDQPLVVVLKHIKAGAVNPQTHIVVSKMEYDDLGRLTSTKKIINSTINGVAVNKPEQTIEIGRAHV